MHAYFLNVFILPAASLASVLSSPSKPIEPDGAEGNFSAGLSAQKIWENCLKEGAHIPRLFLSRAVTAPRRVTPLCFQIHFLQQKATVAVLGHMYDLSQVVL